MALDFMTLAAKITLDSKEYEQGMDDAEKRATGGGSKIKTGLKAVGAGLAVAGAAAATAVGAMTKAAVSGYAEMEQLKGGVETLFGDSAQQVIADANNAFKTAGMDANQYMETSIQSAAAMINSLGGDQKKAAEMVNMSITDMSDNVNKMGTTMESVQDAYRGFSRGNFTMLDNLALGFAGTKEGMQQLLDKAEQISGVKYDINSYADIVQAIHEVQTEMGITGTTAKEASETISGSLASFKTAWSNLLTGFADEDADIDQLIGNVVETATTLLDNLLPVVEKALNGVAEFIGSAAPIIAEKLPDLISMLLPVLIEATISIVVAIAEALPDILVALVDAIVNSIPMIVDAGVKLLSALVQNLPKIITTIIKAVPRIISSLVKAFARAAPEMVKIGGDLLRGIGRGIANGASSVIQSCINVAKKILSAFKKALGISSPSKIMAEYGKFVDEGFALGISQNVDVARRAMDDLAGVVSDPIESADMGMEESMVEVLNTPDASGGSSGQRDMTVILQLDRMQLAKTVFRLNAEEEQRVGVNLAGGFA